MAGTVSNTNKLPVWAVFNGVNLGFLDEGDVTVTITPSWTDQMAHQTGNYLLDAYFNGARVTASMSMSETAEMDRWEDAFSFGEKQIDASTPPEERFAMTQIVTTTNSSFTGARATAVAQKLEFIPVKDYAGSAATETALNLVIQKAFCRDVGDITMSIETGMVLPCTFEGLFDPTALEGENLFWIGKTTETWTAA